MALDKCVLVDLFNFYLFIYLLTDIVGRCIADNELQLLMLSQLQKLILKMNIVSFTV